MTEAQALQWMHLLNCLIIALVVTAVYCIGLIISRAVKLVKGWERREREFMNSVYFKLKTKEWKQIRADLSSDVPIRRSNVD